MSGTRRPCRAACALVVALGVLGACGGDDRPRTVAAASATERADFTYVIPSGTGALIDRGSVVDIIPADLEVRVGQVIRIVNLDDRGHLVGPFFVGKGETLSQRFAATGTLSGACSVHPEGDLTITVKP